jgi:mitochondrial import inner membrane translocase subunit TIM23
MTTSSLQASPLAFHCMSRRSVLPTVSRRNLLSSIRPKSTDVSQAAKDTLPWSEYLAIRRAKRKWEMVSFLYLFLELLLRLREWNQALTIPCVLAGLAGGAAYFGSMELDATKPIMVGEITSICVLASFISPQGIDPLLFFGGATLGCMGMFKCSSYWFPRSPFSYLGTGYLVGPIIGSTLWRVTHRRTMALIEARDREFHQHIVKNRVDPRAQSATNPVPDFYGEQALAPGFTICT